LVETREANERLNEAQGKLLRLIQRKNELERLVEAARGEVVTRRAVLQGDVSRLEAKSKSLPQLEDDLEKTKARLLDLDRLDEELGEKKQRQLELSQQIHFLRSANAQLKVEMETLKEKVDLLSEADARCPLCETELGVEERKRIEAKYEAEGRAKADAYRANEEELKQKSSEHNTLARQVAELETKINTERVAAQSRVNVLEREIGEAKEAISELAKAKEELALVDKRLLEGDYAPSEQAALKELASQIAALGYDAEEHQRVRRRLVELEEYEGKHQSLEEARRFLPREKKALDEAQERMDNWQSIIDAEAQKRETLAAELASLPEIANRIASAQRFLGELNDRRSDNRQLLGAVQQKLADCARLERMKEEKSRALSKAAEEKGIYDELAVAFGKRGIQALIIEAALPEVEEEANRLLARMTDNRMHLKLETQRETRKGETVETLDIRISDELGTRNYEMFSGGESFRINFALRIALSKLLARRAGAPLPTLIMDEGFGTQDRSGMEKLIEAINSIQDDFERIIVITHLEELKDAFPVRINVTKTEQGSMIEVN
jgi:exonuclease SbcC